MLAKRVAAQMAEHERLEKLHPTFKITDTSKSRSELYIAKQQQKLIATQKCKDAAIQNLVKILLHYVPKMVMSMHKISNLGDKCFKARKGELLKSLK